MSVHYQAVGWNPQKKTYDFTVSGLAIGYLGVFAGAGAWLHPNATAETLLIRGFGTLAFLMLHVILCIGPLCRLDRRFLPLLYNRRHLGVMMFVAALVHGVFSMVQFHALGDVNPLVSVLVSNTRYESISEFPFQGLGLVALVILFLMAATSHDFWLKNLSAPVWKRLHMGVYLAYALLVAHVVLGALQTERNPVLAALLVIGVVVVVTLHLVAGRKETGSDRAIERSKAEGFVEACELSSIPEGRGKAVMIGGERVAVFRHEGRAYALSNVCRHQNGPLGEGRIVDGCITCPWHGYQYVPGTGESPPPFKDKVATYETRLVDGKVLVNPCPR